MNVWFSVQSSDAVDSEKVQESVLYNSETMLAHKNLAKIKISDFVKVARTR